MEAQGRARAERTLNMSCMSVTLDVSRLSGWLNADARCREKGEAQEEWRRARKQAGILGGVVGGKQQGGPDCGGSGHARSARQTCTACL